MDSSRTYVEQRQIVCASTNHWGSFFDPIKKAPLVLSVGIIFYCESLLMRSFKSLK